MPDKVGVVEDQRVPPTQHVIEGVVIEVVEHARHEQSHRCPPVGAEIGRVHELCVGHPDSIHPPTRPLSTGEGALPGLVRPLTDQRDSSYAIVTP
ncbi:MAG TPA: hypothetical protein VFW65_18100 [Pseudonocardiaceae bacterium]|nr:hypothetical protein [Pseudonocardiaceae bacterium]